MCCGDEMDEEMSYAEIPAKTEAQQILAALDNIHNEVAEIQNRLDNQATGLNNIGESLTWLVQNTQGLFQMFQSPAFLQQISSMMGGMTNAGQPDDNS
jgi:hypothetical protein